MASEMTNTQSPAPGAAETFRKKPVVVEAVQFTKEVAAAFLFDKVPLPPGVEFASASHKNGVINNFHAYIETLEGRMEVSIGVWIITGVKGERYPCKPDIFAMTYESARTPAPGMAGGVGVTLEEVEQLAKTMWRGEALPGRVLRFGAAVLGLADAAAPHPAPAPQAAGLPITQESKYTISGNVIVNRASGQAIPPDEPIFIFRARDRQACSILGEYAQLCENPEHREAVNERFIQFGEWADANPDRMKEPDSAAAGRAGS